MDDLTDLLHPDDVDELTGMGDRTVRAHRAESLGRFAGWVSQAAAAGTEVSSMAAVGPNGEVDLHIRVVAVGRPDATVVLRPTNPADVHKAMVTFTQARLAGLRTVLTGVAAGDSFVAVTLYAGDRPLVIAASAAAVR